MVFIHFYLANIISVQQVIPLVYNDVRINRGFSRKYCTYNFQVKTLQNWNFHTSFNEKYTFLFIITYVNFSYSIYDT